MDKQMGDTIAGHQQKVNIVSSARLEVWSSDGIAVGW